MAIELPSTFAVIVADVLDDDFIRIPYSRFVLFVVKINDELLGVCVDIKTSPFAT